MDLHQILAKFFSSNHGDSGLPEFKELKERYLEEVKKGGCASCHQRRVRAKYEAIIVKKLNSK